MAEHRVSDNWQQRYVANFIQTGNKEAACIAAGFARSTARSKCSQKHNDPVVQKLLADASRIAEREYDISVRKTVEHMHDRAFYDIGDIAVAEITTPADIARLPERIRRAIDGWDYDAKGNLRLRLANHGAEQERLGKHLGMFVERVDVNLTLTDRSTEDLKSELAKLLAQLNDEASPD